jgi:polyhydroxybutyrate depolymerase
MVILGAAMLLLAVLVFWNRSNGSAIIEHRSMTVDGMDRSYRLVLPTQATSSSLRPLVIALHGALDTTDEMSMYTGLDRLAMTEDFVLVYPQGRLLNWPPSIPDENPGFVEPDLAFIDQLCDWMVESQSVDPKRIYMVGVSQGGGMCNLMVAKRSERFAAAVCNCGWLPDPLGKSPLNTKNKCPMLFIVGSEDRQVSPDVVRAAHDAFEADGHPTTFHLIPGFGHGWDKRHGLNELIWQFLSKHDLSMNRTIQPR